MTSEPGRVGVFGSVLCVVAAVVAGILFVADAHATPLSAVPPVSTRGFPSGPGNPGIFTERCAFSHAAADDPILMPGRTGMAMHHDFFGNVDTNASSTARTLLGGQSSCATSADASAYWIPQLYQDGRAVTPRSALIYWQRAKHDTAPVHSLPAGLEMIAGDEHAKQPQGVQRVAWSCQIPGFHGNLAESASPHSCPPGEHVRLTVRFPSCWNGHSLSAASQTNVAYRLSNRLGCPAGYPVQIPQIVFHVVYPISSAAGLSLSMSPHMTGSTDTAHVDFMDGWNPAVLARDVRACVATQTRCGPVRGPEATPRGPTER